MKLRCAPWVLGMTLACGSVACKTNATSPKPAPVTATKALLPVGTTATGMATAFPDDDAIAKAGQAYLDLLVEVSPERATLLGLHAGDGRLDDRTIAGADDAVAREDAMLQELSARFREPQASPEAKNDLAVLEGALAVDVRTHRVERPLQRQPELYLSPLDAIFAMRAREYAPAADRARNIVARLEQIPGVVAQAKENLLNPPSVWTETAIERAVGAKGFLEGQRSFLEGALPAELTRVTTSLDQAIAAYEEYRAFLQKKVLKRSNGRFAAGSELFAFLLRSSCFVPESASELHAIGRRVFDETSRRMTDLAKRIDPTASGWPEVTARLKKRHPEGDDLLATYEREVKRARAFLASKAVVSFPPSDDLEVKATPPFLRPILTAAYDRPPPFDGVTKGFFFVTPVEPSWTAAKKEQYLREHDLGDVVDTAVHEAYPGHHLQLSVARRHPSKIRRAFDQPIFSEGWALYSEALMDELGYYTDEERLMALEWTLVRAARVILDVELHTKGMTFEQAVKMLTDDVHLEPVLAISEVRRYTATPTQPLSYLVGRERILALRARVREREGANFSLQRFHDDLLARGSISPALLEREIFAEASAAARPSP